MSTNEPSDTAEGHVSDPEAKPESGAESVPPTVAPATGADADEELEAAELVEDEEIVEDPSEVQHEGPPAMPPPAPPVRLAPPPPAPRPPAPRAPPAGPVASPAAPAPTRPPLPTLDDTVDAAIRATQAHGKERAARLIATYEAEIAALGPQSRQRQATYAHEIGELAMAQGDDGAAVKAWARALQADPSLRPNLWTIRRVFERRAMWPNALRLLEAELRFAQSGEERAEVQVERGALLEDRLADVAGARAAYEAAIKDDPMALRAFMALERRLIEDNAAPAQLRDNLAGMAAATRDPTRRTALLIDLARLHANDGGDGFDAAHDVLERAAKVDRGDGASSTIVNAAAAAALDELERLALRAGRPAWREAALNARLEALSLSDVPRPPASAADVARLANGVVLRMRLAADAEERGDPELAFTHLEAAAELASDDASLAVVVDSEIMAVARATGRHEIVGKLALAAAADAPEGLSGILLLEAFDAFERAGLAERMKEAQALAESAGLHDAIDARLRRKAAREGADEALADMYSAEAERAIGEGRVLAAGAWLARAAAILGERLGRPEAAIAAGERALSVLPQGLTYDQHADALEWRFLRVGRYDACAQLLERRIAAATDSDVRTQLLVRHARLASERLDDAAAAARLLREVVAARPDDAAYRYELAALYRRAGAGVEAAEQLGALAERTGDPARKLDLLLERGALLAWHADRVDEGEAALREALRLSPGDGRAAAALEELFERGRANPSNASQLAGDAVGRAEGVITALRAEIDANVHGERLSSALARLAELHEYERADLKAAASVYRELLDKSVEPEERATALRGLARCLRAEADPGPLLAALDSELELLADDRARSRQRARIAWERERRGLVEAAEDDHLRLSGAEGVSPEIESQAQLGLLRRGYRKHDAAAIADALGGLLDAIEPADPAAAGLRVEYARALLDRDAVDEAAEQAARAVSAQPDTYPPQLMALAAAARRDSPRDIASALSLLGEGAAEPVLRASLLARSALVGWVGGEGGDVVRERAQSAALAHASDETRFLRAEHVDDVDTLSARLDLAEASHRADWLWSLAEAQARQGALVAASVSLEDLLRVEPDSVSALELDRRVRLTAGDKAGFAARTLALGQRLLDDERAAVLLAEAGLTWSGIGDLHNAVFAYREALDRTPADDSLYERARSLLVAELDASESESRRWLWAAETFNELLDHRLQQVAGGAPRIDALIDRAQLCAGAGDRSAAERDFRAALELDADETRAVCGLLRLTALDPARLQETRELATRIDSLRIDDRLRRELFLLRADVEQQGAGDPELAIAALDAAVAIEEDAAVVRRLAALLRARRHWQRAIDTRRRLVPLVDPEEAATAELEIAEIYLQGFADSAAAREAALRALKLDPNSHRAVEILSAHPSAAPLSAAAVAVLERAAEAARAALGDAATREASIEQLRSLAGVRGDHEQIALLGQLAMLYGGRTVEPRAQLLLPGGPIGPARDLLRPAVLDSVTRDIFLAMAETATKLYPIDASRMGKLTKPSAKQRKAELAAFDELARLIGLPEMPIELGDGAAIVSDHARIVIGREALPLLLRASGRFRAVRVLALFGDGLGVLDRIDESALVAFLIGTLTAAKLEVPAALNALRPSPAVVEERTRAVDKAIRGREKKALVALAPRLGELGDPRRFRAAALNSALRTALFVSGDLSALAGELGPDGSTELARFAVSAPFLEARRRWRGDAS